MDFDSFLGPLSKLKQASDNYIPSLGQSRIVDGVDAPIAIYGREPSPWYSKCMFESPKSDHSVCCGALRLRDCTDSRFALYKFALYSPRSCRQNPIPAPTLDEAEALLKVAERFDLFSNVGELSGGGFWRHWHAQLYSTQIKLFDCLDSQFCAENGGVSLSEVSLRNETWILGLSLKGPASSLASIINTACKAHPFIDGCNLLATKERVVVVPRSKRQPSGFRGAVGGGEFGLHWLVSQHDLQRPHHDFLQALRDVSVADDRNSQALARNVLLRCMEKLP